VPADHQYAWADHQSDHGHDLGSAKDPAKAPVTRSSFNGTIHVAGRGNSENDVTMEGSVNSTYLKDSAWFKATGNQEGGAVDEGDGVSVTHQRAIPIVIGPKAASINCREFLLSFVIIFP
jgi:hypothetical protein